MHLPSSSRRRAPLSPLQSNTLGPSGSRGSKAQEARPAAGAGSRLGQRQAPSGAPQCSASRIPGVPAGGAAPGGVQRPGETPASRIPRATPSPPAGAALPAAAAASPAGSPPGFHAHDNPAFDGEAGAEWDPGLAGAASPTLSCYTDGPGQRDLTPGVLDQSVYTPATARSIQAWLRAGTPTARGVPGTVRPAPTGAAPGPTPLMPTPLMPTPEAWQLLEAMGQAHSPAPEGGGMFNIMNAYLRTGAQMLSPEPGCEGGAAIRAPAYMAAVVTKAAGGALRPAAVIPAAAAPGSARGSASVSSCIAAGAASLGGPSPALQLAAEEEQGGGKHVVLRPAVHAHDELPSVGRGQVDCTRPGPPSPISFNLPVDSPNASPAQNDKPESPTFSFGMRGNEQPAPGEQQQQQPLAAEAEAAAAPEMVRLESDKTVEQPNPFQAMLCHLRGPQYASPAPAIIARAASPKSPSECKPLLLPGDAGAPAVAATPELGKGSLSCWIDRRGLRQALNTPARLDLQVLWAAMRDNQHVRGEADGVREENAALERELARVQELLRELGVEYHAAVEAAEANQVYAEAEIARAREAAQQMVALSNQIQQMFNLCEAEKTELLAELAAAQQRLAEAEAGSANLGDMERAELEQHVEGAREAVAAAQRAADLAEARANEACSELLSIKAELQATQQQLAAQAQPQATPVATLRTKLRGVQDALAGLQSRQQGALPSPGLAAKRAELQQLLVQSKEQLGAVQALLGGEDEATALRVENQALRLQLQEARALLSAHTPASAKQEERDQELHALFGSPTPLRLSAEFAMASEASAGGSVSLASGGCSLAGSSGAGSPALSDLFSSPYIASQATLTVDYRELHGAVLADTAASRVLTPEQSEDLVEFGSPGLEAFGLHAAEPGFTVVHNRLIVTNVPASEVSKVKSMVQYWEAVAGGHMLPGLPGVAAEGAADGPADDAGPDAADEPAEGAADELGRDAAAEAVAEGPVEEAVEWAVAGLAQEEGLAAAAPSTEALAPAQPAADEDGAEEQLVSELAAAAVQQRPAPEGDEGPAAAAPEATPQQAQQPGELVSHPLETPFTITSASWTPASAGASAARSGECASASLALAASPAPPLPEGLVATPVADKVVDLVGPSEATPARFTPLNFAAAVPPAPHNTPAAAAHATPTGVAAPATAATPGSAGITPLSLSALRRAGSSDMQAAVRSRLQRLKADLQKAQAKLITVDQGLAAIASPASSVHSLASTPTGSRKSPTTPTSAPRAASPFVASDAGSPASAAVAPAPAGPAAAAQLQEALAPQPAAAAASPVAVEVFADENQASNRPPLAATPAEQKRSVRFAEKALSGCHSSKPALRASTPGTGLLSSVGHLSPAAGGSAVRRAPSPGVLRSTTKPAGPSPLRLAALAESDSEASNSDSSDDEDVFDRSRMAMQAVAATPKPAKTPMAHPDGPAATPQSVAFSSTSSFSPPEPLALVSIMPFNRVRRGAGGAAAGRRRPSETEEREFRRRAAALKIQISPYFKRR